MLHRRQLFRLAVASGLAGLGARGAQPQPVRDAVSVAEFGARADAVSDNSAAFHAAIESGAKLILIPSAARPYLLRKSLAPRDGQEIAGEGGAARLLFALAQSGAGINLRRRQNVTLSDLSIAAAPPVDGFRGIDIESARACTIARVQMLGLGGPGVRISDGQSVAIADSVFSNGADTAIEISGRQSFDNAVLRCIFTRNRGFGCRLTGGAYNNLVHECATRERNGIELVGITYDSYANVVTRNHALGCGDNGISVTGDSNVVTDNLCEGNAFHGICVYGSSNLVLGNRAINNGQASRSNAATYAGFAVVPGWGGLGRSNSFVGNMARDDQAQKTQSFGYKVTPSSYSAWRAGTEVARRQFVLSGGSIYVSTAPGRSGSRAPTHRAGTASDGGVTWLHIASADSYDATANAFIGNTSEGARLAAYDLRGSGTQRVDGRSNR